MELLNCGWGSKVSKGKNQKQKNEAWGMWACQGDKENTLNGSRVFQQCQKKKEFQHVFSMQAAHVFACPGQLLALVANDLVQE